MFIFATIILSRKSNKVVAATKGSIFVGQSGQMDEGIKNWHNMFFSQKVAVNHALLPFSLSS